MTSQRLQPHPGVDVLELALAILTVLEATASRNGLQQNAYLVADGYLRTIFTETYEKGQCRTYISGDSCDVP